jgi:hypothetical protein
MSRATENLERMIAELPPRKGPRLNFPQQCGAYFALHRGFERTLVAKAFGISVSAASLLANCQRDASRHYAKVAREFNRLGEIAFGEAYYTDEIDSQILRIRAHRPEPTDIRQRLSDARADKYEGNHTIINAYNDEIAIEIAYRPATDINWKEDDGSQPPPTCPARWAWRNPAGSNRWSVERYRTSSDCFDAAHIGNGVESPRARSGRWKP